MAKWLNVSENSNVRMFHLADSATIPHLQAPYQRVTDGATLDMAAGHGESNHRSEGVQICSSDREAMEWLRKRNWTGRTIADQLFDSGTSIGANSAESQGGQTKPDFTARLAIARKESWETIFWLKLAIATSLTTKEQVAWELDEAQQLRAMITQAVKTAQCSSSRGNTDGKHPDG